MTPVWKAISTLQAMGYIVREAPDFEATLQAEREQGREEALAVLQRLRDEAECSCQSCIRTELGGIP